MRNKLWLKGTIALLFVITSILVMSSDVNAGDPPKVYFKFDIPIGCHYSPGWFGVMDKCPKDVVVLYYNDKAGYGYAYTYTPSTSLSKLAVVTPQSTVDSVLVAAKDEKDIYYGEKIYNRWLPEIKIEEFKVYIDEKGLATIIDGSKPTEELYGKVEVKKAVVCPTCGSFIFWYYDGVLDRSTVITCPLGHKLITINYETLDAVKEAEALIGE